MATLAALLKQTADEIERAFEWFRAVESEVTKIEANPSLMMFIDQVSIDVPVEYKPTESGIRFIGESLDDPNQKVEYNLRVLDDETCKYLGLDTYTGESFDKRCPIRAWAFNDAPESLKKLSEHGGDEDWIFVIPPNIGDRYISWVDDPTYVDIERYILPGGWQVVISAH